MRQEDVLVAVLDRLEQMGIPYMITGSFASNLYGVVRNTQDADVVIQADERSVRDFAEVFRGDYFADPLSASDALKHHSIFNIIHIPTAFKVDMIFSKPRAYSRESFRRRTRKPFFGKERWFSTAEDTILSKLEWSRLAGSDRQADDAMGIAKVQQASLDVSYIRHWGMELGIQDLVDRLLVAIGRMG